MVWLSSSDYPFLSLQINLAATDKEIQTAAMNAMDTLLECGFCKPFASLSLSDREEMLHAMALHFIILRPKAELDQLREGLASVGVAEYMELYAEILKPLFVSTTGGPLRAGQWELGCNLYSNCAVKVVLFCL